MEWRVRAGRAGITGSLALLAFAGCSAFDPSLLSRAGSSAPDGGRDRHDASVDQGGTMQPDAHVGPHSDAGNPQSTHDSGSPGAQVGEADAGDDDAGATDASATDAGAMVTACVPSTVDFCAHVPALPAPAVIDGELDCGPVLRALDPVGWNGTDALPAGDATSVAAAWRADGLYFYVKVVAASVAPHTSAGLNCGDAVELYVDADGTIDASGAYADPGTMQFIIGAPSASSPGTLETQRFVSGNQREWSSPRVKTKLLPDGYAVEAFITAADLGLSAWSPSMKLGLDVVIDVSGSANFRCGNQVGQYFLKLNASGNCAGSRGEPWCDSRSFCTPALD